jgi:hypothetical protein
LMSSSLRHPPFSNPVLIPCRFQIPALTHIILLTSFLEQISTRYV